MMEFVEFCFAGPSFPATVLLILIMLYGLLVVLGAADVDLFDFDFDSDFDIDGGAESVGFVALKFLNIGNVPIMIWITVFGLFWWTTSVLLGAFYDQTVDPEKAWGTAQLIFRNVFIAIIVTKCATEPMRKLFDHTDNYKPNDLVGKECEVTTYEVTAEKGQARFATDAAPLLIDVRSEDDVLSKGERATIVDFDPDTKIYYITKTDTEVS